MGRASSRQARTVGYQAFLLALPGHPLVKITSPKVNNELLGHVGETLIDESRKILSSIPAFSIPVQFYGLPSTNNDIPQIILWKNVLGSLFNISGFIYNLSHLKKK